MIYAPVFKLLLVLVAEAMMSYVFIQIVLGRLTKKEVKQYHATSKHLLATFIFVTIFYGVISLLILPLSFPGGGVPTCYAQEWFMAWPILLVGAHFVVCIVTVASAEVSGK